MNHRPLDRGTMPPSRSAFPASRLQSATGGVAAAKSPSSAEPKNRHSTLFKPHLPSRAEFEARSRHSERCSVQRPRAFRLLEHRYEIGEACRQRADRWGMRDAATAGNAAKNVPAGGVASRSHFAPGRLMPQTCDIGPEDGSRISGHVLRTDHAGFKVDAAVAQQFSVLARLWH